MILNGTGAYNTNSKDTINSELNKNLRQLNTNICCLNNSSSTATDDYEYIPIFEYIKAIYPILQLRVSTINPIDVNILIPKSVVYTMQTPVQEITIHCNDIDYTTTTDYVTSIYYEDSMGRNGYFTTNALTIDNTAFPNTIYTTKITAIYSSGVISVFTEKISLNSNADVTPVSGHIITSIRQNVNAVNSPFTFVNSGYINIPLEIPVKSLLEVRKNGIFMGYKDTTNSSYTPTYCLSYSPVTFIQDFTTDPVIPKYNNVSHDMLSSSSKTYLANSVHIFSINAISGTVTLTIDSTAPIIIPTGTSITFPATTLISKDIIVDATAGVSYITITTP